MKIVEDTDTQLTIFCPRKLMGDLFAVVFLAFGAAAIAGAVFSPPDPTIQILFLFGVAFAGVGIFIALTHSSTTATLDATTQTVTIQWRPLKGPQVKTIPFADITRIALHDDDDCQTIEFRLSDKTTLLLEKGHTGNSKAAPMARHMDDWLSKHRLDH